MNAKEAMAARAVWAFMQDKIVGLAMVPNLQDHVNMAVTIASVTKSDREAIELAQEEKMQLAKLPEVERRGRSNRR